MSCILFLPPLVYKAKGGEAHVSRSGFNFGYWWIFPIIMIGMMILCFFLMRKHRGSMKRMMNKMGDQSCCAHGTGPEPEGEKKRGANNSFTLN